MIVRATYRGELRHEEMCSIEEAETRYQWAARQFKECRITIEDEWGWIIAEC